MAVEAHAGQVDKAGRPYILHPLAVMFAAERAYNVQPSLIVYLEEFMAAAVLHDVPEDNPEPNSPLSAGMKALIALNAGDFWFLLEKSYS